ncbi:type II secretion system F family protein [Pseudonocardia acaciae]|uniref:type II secretion system F family protein n=1 Tax=Pseudonocardia acaciae TaxID=551276 RepID=UPI000566C203|nr:type II secretion system F family protein [Pseudonocardia acaciae]
MTSLLLLAAALVIAPSSSPGRSRLLLLYPPDTPPGPTPQTRRPLLAAGCGLAIALLTASTLGGITGAVLALPLGLGAAVLSRRLLARSTAPAVSPLRLAGGWDLLAACLRAGLPVAPAVRAAAARVAGPTADELRTIADRLALGADPKEAWQVADSSPVHKLARAARRSARSGASLAAVAEAAAAEIRASALDLVTARGQRAGVLITGPLGLCFLPAFLSLGVVPVVIGLATGLSTQW